jgi:hypothetical protein
MNDIFNNPWISSALSILLLAYMINQREEITPASLHFFTSWVDDEVNFLCIMVYWLTWKCFLIPQENQLATNEQKVQQRIKTVVLGLLEMLLALSMC